MHDEHMINIYYNCIDLSELALFCFFFVMFCFVCFLFVVVVFWVVSFFFSFFFFFTVILISERI